MVYKEGITKQYHSELCTNKYTIDHTQTVKFKDSQVTHTMMKFTFLLLLHMAQTTMTTSSSCNSRLLS